jgi:malonate-semialdehyde dehydrogenase (acetylating)/methylmalonate-semialdehyde dehydrogenase
MAKEEAFGAVSALIRGESLDQAIEWINTRTDLGHSAAIMTQSGKNARKMIREANVGNVAVNLGVAQPYAFFPLGSRRESFVGTAKSTHGLHANVHGRKNRALVVCRTMQLFALAS